MSASAKPPIGSKNLSDGCAARLVESLGYLRKTCDRETWLALIDIGA